MLHSEESWKWVRAGALGTLITLGANEIGHYVLQAVYADGTDAGSHKVSAHIPEGPRNSYDFLHETRRHSVIASGGTMMFNLPL